MYKTFKYLAVDTQSQLYDQKRIKRIFMHYYLGYFIVILFCSVFTVLSAITGSWVLWILWDSRSFESKELWMSLGVSLLFFVICFVMTKAFLKEIINSDFIGYLKRPQNYCISEGKIEKAEYIPGSGGWI